MCKRELLCDSPGEVSLTKIKRHLSSPVPQIYHRVLKDFSHTVLILQHCTIRDILKLRLVNKWFYQLCTSDVVWQKFNVMGVKSIYRHFDSTLSELSSQERQICYNATQSFDRSAFGIITKTGIPTKSFEQNKVEPFSFRLLHNYTKLLIVTGPFLYSDFFGEINDSRVVRLAVGCAGIALYMSEELVSDRKLALWVAKWDPLAATCLRRYLDERKFQIAFVQANKGQAFYFSPEALDPTIVKLFLAGEGYFWMVGLIPPEEFQKFKTRYPFFASIEFVRLLYERDRVTFARIDEYYPEMMDCLEIIVNWVECAGPTAFCSLSPQLQEHPQVLSACFNVPRDHWFYNTWFDRPSYLLGSFAERLRNPEYAKKLIKIEPNVLPAALHFHSGSICDELKALAQDVNEVDLQWPTNEKLRYRRLGWMYDAFWLLSSTRPRGVELHHIMERCHGPDYI